ncbi:MAG: glycosyltransferase family 4 protein [Bacteroidota bacterium]
MPEKKKKVLVVTYYWLPQSGTGTYRISKFVKYLLKEGWEPIILTPEKSAASFKEESIEPPYDNVKVYRTKIFEPTFFFKSNTGNSLNVTNASFFLSENLNLKQRLVRWIRLNIFIPDAKILWKPFGVKMGKRLIQQEKPDLIFSTSPPPTTHLVARKLAKWSDLKWIADFRDPWTNIYYYELLKINPISKRINRKLEDKVIQSADKIITVSDNFFSQKEAKSKNIRIENGYDPEDLNDIKLENERNHKFTIRYIGSLKTNQFFKNFFLILKELEQQEEYRNKIKLEFIGYVDPSIREFIAKQAIKTEINIQGYVPHKEAIKKMASADLLVLAIGQGELSKNVVSTKIYEYLMVQKPILAFGHPDGTANRILQETNAGKMFSYKDYQSVRQYFFEIYNNWLKNKNYISQIENSEKYNFYNLTARLHNIFEQHLNG